MLYIIAQIKKSTTRVSKKYGSGFTLIEFIVILVIFSIMASVALFNFNGFQSKISLTNLAQDIALTIRTAQVTGISASESIVDIGSKSRGVYFGYDGSQFEKEFILFSDRSLNANPADGLFDPVSDDAEIDRIAITTTDTVSSIQGVSTSGNGNLNPITQDVHITFVRPSPDARIFAGGNRYSYIEITVTSEDGREKVIEVSENGRINVAP
jgi:Tfp pilus assembly protein FimT